MPDIVVFGIGNTLRGDDGIGAVIIHKLQQSFNHPGISYCLCHQLTPELVELILSSQLVVFVDADCSLPPGTWEMKDIEVKESQKCANIHALTPQNLLSLAHTLSGQSCQALLVSIGPEQFDEPDRLSDSIKSIVDPVVENLVTTLQKHLTANID